MNKEFYMKEGDIIGWLKFRHHVIDNDIEGAVVYCDDGKVIHLNRFGVPTNNEFPRYEDKVLDLTSELIQKQINKRKRERDENR